VLQKLVAEVNQTVAGKVVAGGGVIRGCSSFCFDVNLGGQGWHCCDDMDLCNTATTTSPILAVTMATCLAVLVATFRRQ
jgi:hypothetical protein